MSRRWVRSVAGCSAVAVLAGAVALTATAVDADRAASTGSAPAADPSAAAATGPSAAPGVGLVASLDGRPRAGDDSAASVAVPPGWRDVATQRLVPVTPGRFDSVVALDDRAVVLVGTLDATPSRVPDRARRLAASAADALDPGTRPVPVADAVDTVDGRPAWTTTLRTPPRPGTGGTLLRVTTVAAGRSAPALVLLAVVRPGPDAAADAATADAVVRSVRGAEVSAGRGSAATRERSTPRAGSGSTGR